MSAPRQDSRPQNNALLESYLQTDDPKEAERLLAELLARGAPFIDSRLGRRFRVSIAGGRCRLNPDAEDQYNEVNLLLVEKLRNLKAASSEEPIRDFQGYVEKIADNAFLNYLRQEYKQLRSVKDALRYLLSGRTRHKRFGLWRREDGKLVGGFAEWRDERRDFTRTKTYQQLLDDPHGFARTKFPSEEIRGIGRVELVDAVFRWVGCPVELDDLVKVIAILEGVIPSSEEDHSKTIEDAPDETPTPLDTLQSKSDMQVIWQDLRRLTVEQRRALLLQAQHDVIEILLRSGVATIGEIAATLEMAVEEIEQLRATGFLSDEQLGRRFSSLKATIMQQRNRARHKMAELRKRW